MTFEELDLSEFPASRHFVDAVDKQFYLWEMYKPTTIQADFPFEQDWWKYAYWMPKIKKEFYLMAIQAPDFEKALAEKCKSYGIDLWFFCKHYNFFVKRLEWMRKNNGATHIGEVEV